MSKDGVSNGTEVYPTMPATDRECKKVTLRAERGDTVDVEGYGEMEVKRRQMTYYGTVLNLYDKPEQQGYELYARDPREQLRLVERVQDEEGFVIGLRDLGEAKAELVDVKRYDFCECGEPVKTLEHERMAWMGVGQHG